MTRECVYKLLSFYLVVFASGELKNYGNAPILCIICKTFVFFMRDMRYKCVVRFSDGYRGEKDVCLFCE